MKFNQEAIIFVKYVEPRGETPFIQFIIRPNKAVDEDYWFDLPVDKFDHNATSEIRRFIDEVDARNEVRASRERADLAIGLLGLKDAQRDEPREVKFHAAYGAFFEAQKTMMQLGLEPPKIMEGTGDVR